MEKPAYWAKSKIFINGETQKRLMIVFKTPPCQKMVEKGRCFVCGFDIHSSGVKNPNYNLLAQFNFFKKTIKKNNINHIDILSSGSILDEKQINYSQILETIEEISKIKQIKSVLIEGRVEYCDLKKIKQIKQILKDIKLEYGVGLESFSDYVRNEILKKDLKIKDYINCLKKLTKINVGICTYILLGAPKLSLEKSLEDARKSIIKVVDLYKKYHCQGRIALFPIFIVPNTPLEELYNQGKYKLTNLGDIIKLLSEIKKEVDFKKYPIFVGLDDENLANKVFLKTPDLETKRSLETIKKFNYSQRL